jgi:alkylhydroperoxidase family enzyme
VNTFLPPIEKPDGLMKKLAYYFTRKQFGKVSTPVKVHSAWLPAAFGSLDKKLTLPREMVLLIREQVARLNVCSFCMDIGRSFAKRNRIRNESLSKAKRDRIAGRLSKAT